MNKVRRASRLLRPERWYWADSNSGSSLERTLANRSPGFLYGFGSPPLRRASSFCTLSRCRQARHRVAVENT